MPRACLLKTRHRNVCVLCVIECGPDKKTKNVVVEVTFYGHWLSPWSLVKGLLNIAAMFMMPAKPSIS